ncbi:hypothetical protein [Maribacter aestuarii]|uniref:hypothetical protein n=1 Tax=Maribacter aestuarii TaxID=1130723 RepID=UPI00248BB63A|nr:hypothetical protein [Maribacter aestuarii]
MRSTFIFTIVLVILSLGCSTDSMDSSMNSDEDLIQATAPRTNITDAAFEQALVELGYDDVVDGTVITADIAEVNSLVLNDKGLTDLSGIQDFKALDNLWVNDNEIVSLDVSSNILLKFIFIEDNGLTSLSLPASSILEKVSAFNNNLTSLDITSNTGLQVLSLANNAISAIDISNVPNAFQLNTFSIEENPLTCIKVNEFQLESIPDQWTKDVEDIFALVCN